MPDPIAFTIGGPAVSGQSNNRVLLERWKDEVRSAASEAVGTGPVEFEYASVTITYFFLHGRRIDLDNLAEGILDAMTEVVYADDRWVFDLHCHKRDLKTLRRIDGPSALLLRYIATQKPFVHIAVTRSEIQEVPNW